MDENTFYKKYYQSKPITELTREEVDEYLLMRDVVMRMFTEVIGGEVK